MKKIVIAILMALSVSACKQDITETENYKKGYSAGYSAGYADGYDIGLENQYARMCDKIEHDLNSGARSAVCR